MARLVSFRQSLLKTCYSETLEKFIRIYLVEEETASEFLAQLDLAGLTKEEFACQLVQAYLADPSIYTDLDDDEAEKLTWELFDLILDANPYLDPANMEQIEVPTPKRSRRKRKKLDIAESVQVYQRVKMTLEANIVGQREAVNKVIDSVGRGLLRSDDEVRPICALLLCGASGVGKTELARQLSAALGPDTLIKIDCSEYSESHQISRLIGAPAGYTGFGMPTMLERRLDKDKLQVLLFDEFEKADRTLCNFLLGVLEDGIATTSTDEVLRFRNCVILLTSNLGARQMVQHPLGFAEAEDNGRSVLAVVKKELPVEFVNRLTEIILFGPLTADEQEQVALLEFEKLKRNVQHLVKLTWAADAPRGVVGRVGLKEKGARSIRRYMDGIHSDIARLILSGKIEPGVEFQAK